jgi:hypothetical protein
LDFPLANRATDRAWLLLAVMKQTLLLAIAIPALTTACIDGPQLGDTEQAVKLSKYSVRSTTAAVTGTDQQLIAACPRGTVALGASFAVLDSTLAYANGTQLASVPAFDGRTWIVNARQNWGLSAWNLRVRLTCAIAPKSYEVVSDITATDTFPVKQLAISCPAGKVATGAGFAVVDKTGVFLPGEASYFMPTWDGTGWLTNAHPLGVSQPWALRSYLVCADPAELDGYQVETAESPLDATSPKQVIGGCLGSQVMTGAGWGVVDDTYAILDGRAIAHEIDFTGTRWLTNAENQSTFAPQWRLQQRALCVD